MYPEGQVELKNERGEVIGIFELPETTAILPGETVSVYLDGVQDVPDGDYKAVGTIDFGWDHEQIEAADVPPEEWSQQESQEEITFNSVPKLRVVEVQMEGTSESGTEVTLAVENYGDVEVSPAGFVDVLNADGERAALLNITAGSWAVEPHSKSTRQYSYRGVIPKGDYSLDTKLSFNGENTASKTGTTRIEEDIIPAVAPAAPQARRIQYSPGTPGWVWGALSTAALMVVAALGAAAWMVRRLVAERQAGLVGPGATATISGPVCRWDGPRDSTGSTR
jgi:hypothetical protein